MEGRLSSGSVDRPGVRWDVGMRVCGGGSRGATSWGAGLVDQVVVGLICEGWLPQNPCSSPGSQSRTGRHPAHVGGYLLDRASLLDELHCATATLNTCRASSVGIFGASSAAAYGLLAWLAHSS